MHNYFDCF